MEVKIGIQSAARELVIETDATADEVEAALKSGLVTQGGVLVLADARGGRVLIPADKIAYLEFGATQARRVGFSSS